MLVGLFPTGTASGSDFTFTFDPDDLINLYPSDATGDKTSQADGRSLRRDATSQPASALTWTSCFGLSGSGDYGSAAYYGAGQDASYNTYLNWREGLGSGEGIRQFNMLIPVSGGWGSSPNFTSWAPQVVREHTDASYVTGTAADGWTPVVFDLGSIYGGAYGVVWYTTDPASYLRPGIDHADFSFTVSDLLYDGNNDGVGERPLQYGDAIRIWFGSGVMVFDDQGWGTRPGYAPYSYVDDSTGNGSEWNGVMATVVPEPASFSLLGFGLLAVAALRRKRN